MASGQQKAQQNLEAFEVWKATQTDDDFKQIVFRGQLIELKCCYWLWQIGVKPKSCPRKALKALEMSCAVKVLPPLTDAAKKNEDKPQTYDNTANRKLRFKTGVVIRG